jgi:hypothetical protein
LIGGRAFLDRSRAEKKSSSVCARPSIRASSDCATNLGPVA